MIRFLAGLLLACAMAGAVHADELLVSAASSLNGAFQEMAKGYEQSHSGTKVVFSFGASGHNLQQLVQGAPMDVFATADTETMDRAAAQSLVSVRTRVNFAGNRLVLVVASDTRTGIRTMADLAQAGVRRVAFANPAAAPFARYAKEALEGARLWDAVSPKFVFADNVRQALTYITRGEVDAGFVYATDAAIERERIRIVAEIATRTPIVYPVARVSAARNPGRADEFIAYLLSDAGSQVLLKHGFARP